MNSDSTDKIYKKLRKHLDSFPVGYPKTESGVELKILKELFNPEHAMIALRLGIIPQTVDEIYPYFKRREKSREWLEFNLNEMLKKGVINGGTGKERGKIYYSIAALAVGIFEYQVNRLSPSFARNFVDYMDEAYRDEILKTKVPQMRTIPSTKAIKTIEVKEMVEHKNIVTPFDEVEQLLADASDTISLSNCICRQTKDILGKGCNHPKETCFQFGGAAHYYIDNGLGRKITKEEVLKIIREGQKLGLVLQPSNTQRPFALCMCCGCSCEILTNAKKLENPAQYFHTNYYAEVIPENCTGCKLCEAKCPMDAAKVVNEISTVDLTRCIGCGVCVTFCNFDAIRLVKKEKEVIPPRNTLELYQKIAVAKASKE
ncbi:MAG: 4Fe-4S binding protein [Candidatus Lokiarchaeota archaeon]|nr:4Fe-4S binding protein [Candidatus Lokiarchaeota archaeon]